jgi:hypothetical protein
MSGAQRARTKSRSPGPKGLNAFAALGADDSHRIEARSAKSPHVTAVAALAASRRPRRPGPRLSFEETGGGLGGSRSDDPDRG